MATVNKMHDVPVGITWINLSQAKSECLEEIRHNVEEHVLVVYADMPLSTGMNIVADFRD
jgi:hypothetical protein